MVDVISVCLLAFVAVLCVTITPLTFVDPWGYYPTSYHANLYIKLSNGNKITDIAYLVGGSETDYYVDIDKAIKAYGVSVTNGKIYSADQKSYITYSISDNLLTVRTFNNIGLITNTSISAVYYAKSGGSTLRLINFNYFQTLMCNLGYNLSYNTYRGDYTALTEEEKLFVATVAGEMIGEAEITWKIVANVIMNRVGKREWKKYTTVTDVIKYSGFDAYSKNTTEFQKAKQYLNSRGVQTNTRYENLINIVLPIYR